MIETIRTLMTSQDPVSGVLMLKEQSQLYNTFKFPEGYLAWEMDQNTPWHKLNVFEHSLEALSNLQKIYSKYFPDTSSQDRFAMNCAILFHDLGKLNTKVHGKKTVGGKTRTTYIGHEEYSLKAAEHILKSFSDVTEREISRVKLLIDGARMVNPSYVPTNEKCPSSRKTIGKFIRHLGDDWKYAILVSMADASGKDKNIFDSFDFTYHMSMIQLILDMNPKVVQALQPLVSDDRIKELTDCNDYESNKIRKRLIEFQLEHSKATEKDAENYVKSFKRRTK